MLPLPATTLNSPAVQDGGGGVVTWVGGGVVTWVGGGVVTWVGGGVVTWVGGGVVTLVGGGGVAAPTITDCWVVYCWPPWVTCRITFQRPA